MSTLNHETEMCKMKKNKKIIKTPGHQYGPENAVLFLDRSVLGQATDGDEKPYGGQWSGQLK